tara:strand:+ start:755 stop:1414 length:660 start_codon:yes stop_codon:yes gene_type:complete
VGTSAAKKECACGSRALFRAIRYTLSAPVVGICLGALCGSLPAVKALLLPADSAPLGWVLRGLARIGDAAVPTTMLLMGVSVSRGPEWRAIRMATNVGVCVAKLVLMPLLMLGAAVAMRYVRTGSLGEGVTDVAWSDISSRHHQASLRFFVSPAGVFAGLSSCPCTFFPSVRLPFFLWVLLFWTDVAWSNVSSPHPAAKQTLIWTLSKASNPPPHTHTH